MTLLTSIRYRLIFLALAFLAGLFFIRSAYAQETGNPDQAVKKYGITFPIADLGNCNSFSECRNYCNDSSHQDACVAFARKKGFYKEPEHKDQAILNDAKSLLGCDSETSCKTVCENPDNHDKCAAFAQKHNLGGPTSGIGNAQILQKAKGILGCDSESSCKTICEDPSNQQKCSDFAKQTGMGGGEHRVGPGGCTSEDSCRAYCQSHQDECSKFSGGNEHGGPPPESQRKGPGGCNSPESCQAYCNSHPQECGIHGGDNGSGRPNPSQNPNDFCKQNPDKCRGPQGQGMSDESFTPPSFSPRQQNLQPQGNPQQGGSFNQGFSGGIPNPDRNFHREDQSNSGDNHGDTNQNTAEPDGGNSNPGSVQGISTEPNIFQRILNLFRR